MRQSDGVASLASQVIVTNSIADTSILAYTVPADVPAVGTVLRMKAYGNLDNSAVATSFNVWVKNNAGTKVATLTFATPAVAQTLRTWEAEFMVTWRTTGVGTIVMAGNGSSNATVTITMAANFPRVVQTATTAYTTTVANTFTLGMNWTAAAATNIGRCDHAVMEFSKL